MFSGLLDIGGPAQNQDTPGSGGLLGFASSPAGQGLLSAAFGAAASARRGRPWNTLGAGGLAGLTSYAQALDRQRLDAERSEQMLDRAANRQYRNAQMEEINAKLVKQRGENEWRAGLPGVMQKAQTSYGAGDEGPTMTPADPEALRRYAMQPNSPFADDVLKGMFVAKPQEAFTLGPGQTRFGADGRPVASMPKESNKTNVELMLDAAGISDPVLRQTYMKQALTKSVTHAPAANTNVVLKQETEEAKKVGGFFGEEYGNILKAGTLGQGKLNRYSRLGELLQGVQTGKFTETGLEVAKAARSLGFNVGENVGNLEAAQALSGEIALELRNPSGGAGMPGAMSDADRQFLVNMVPGLATTPEGRTLMLDTAQRLAKRDMDVARIAREYRKRNGSIDEGFYDELAKFSAANPLFSGGGQRSGTQPGFKIRRVN
ncbi:hypothetical protein [Hydrogenophaga sp. T2]|uniref:hypothetical protein n=1 Tax=Hydrogenophaga sp. T2 TaxID=3132823 RepID=UPI003CEBCBC1